MRSRIESSESAELPVEHRTELGAQRVVVVADRAAGAGDLEPPLLHRGDGVEVAGDRLEQLGEEVAVGELLHRPQDRADDQAAVVAQAVDVVAHAPVGAPAARRPGSRRSVSLDGHRAPHSCRSLVLVAVAEVVEVLGLLVVLRGCRRACSPSSLTLSAEVVPLVVEVVACAPVRPPRSRPVVEVAVVLVGVATRPPCRASRASARLAPSAFASSARSLALGRRVVVRCRSRALSSTRRSSPSLSVLAVPPVGVAVLVALGPVGLVGLALGVAQSVVTAAVGPAARLDAWPS